MCQKPQPPVATPLPSLISQCPKDPKDYIIIQKFSSEPKDPDDRWYWDLAQWGKDWKRADPKSREIWEVESASEYQVVRARIVDAFKNVVACARGRMIILAVGHGTGIEQKSTQYNSKFDFGAQLGRFDHHLVQVQKDIFTLRDKDAAAPGGKLQATSSTQQAHYDVVRDLYKMLEEIGVVMKAGPTPSELRLLTCNVGNDAVFLKRLAQVLNVPLGAYNELVWLSETDPPRIGFMKYDNKGNMAYDSKPYVDSNGVRHRVHALDDASTSELPKKNFVKIQP
jgi:hypothetical protein